MSTQKNTELAHCIERARRVLLYEQRTNHQDRAIKPGGLEAFAARWVVEMSNLARQAGLDLGPVHRFTTQLEGYRVQDPMQRASSLRAALSTLDELDGLNGLNTGDIDGTVATNDAKGMRSPDSVSLPGRSQPPGPTIPEREPASNRTAAAPDAAVVPSAPARSTAPANTQQASQKAPVRAKADADTSAAKATSATPAMPMAPVVPAASAQQRSRQEQDTLEGVQLEAGMSRGHTALTLLSADVTAVPGVGSSVAAKLHYLGIRTVNDLLLYFPREHRDYSQLEKIANIPFGATTTTMGLIWEVETQRIGNGRSRTVATISDETGKLRVSWFNQPYLQKQLKAAQGSYLVVTGIKQRFGNKIEFSVRSHELPEQGDLLNTGRLVPIYPLTEGLHAKTLRRFTKWAVDRYAAMVAEYLPQSIRLGGQLLPLAEAVAQIHYPESQEMLAGARKRLAFDELFLIQLGMQERRTRWQHETPQGKAFSIDFARVFIDPPPALAPDLDTTPTRSEDKDTACNKQAEGPMLSQTLWSTIATDKPFEATLPYHFTAAQRRVICEITADLARNEPMCRLLQGDVGAGKTAVAAAALFMAALNGYQGAIMAPTELLAEQHAHSISTMLEPFGIHNILLTGSMRTRERVLGRAALESGEAAIAVGTHALIQDEVNFQRLGLVIIDEQHRFGVEQRDALRQKGYHPHMLVMTATPIPRTLALTLYGDLDVSVIDQLPPGRQKIITRWRTGARRSEANTTIMHQVAEGHQAFIICPLIEESESLAVKAATVEYERLQKEVFPHLRLGLLHGAMKSGEKDQVMRRFRDHELDILVATSVIEVGIDVPNATVTVIEDADRFGLSQLHQFRGRVGRGKHQSYCYVLSADASMQAQERLSIFQDTDDGFRLSEEDLRLRGPGDFFGVRQSGMPELRMANLSDTALIEQTRTLAGRLWESDPYLRKPEHVALRQRMHTFWQSFMAH